MSRTITEAAAEMAAMKNGAEILHILEIEWGGEVGSVFLSDQSLVEPVEAAAKVLSWGSIVSEAKPDQVGGFSDSSVDLIDVDYSLRELFDTEPGPAAKPVKIHLFFAGTEWPDDRVTIFSGLIAGDVQFDAATAVWKLSLKGQEKFYDKSLGTPLTRDKFPTIRCTDHEGKIIPLVYGKEVKRVPARLIKQPGHAYLSEPASEHATSLQLTKTCNEMGCTPGTPVTVIVGIADLWERCAGQFSSSGSSTFAISSRGSILASGESPGVYGLSGQNYFLINKSDLPSYDSGNPTAELPSLAGYPLWINDGDYWSPAFVIDKWIDNGSTIAVLQEPVGVTFETGWHWKIGSQVGLIPRWPTSTPVEVADSWVYAVSHTPAAEVQRVEVRSQIQTAGGGKGGMRYYVLNPDRYTVALDNKSFNAQLGRETGDPGVTTISLGTPPSTHGFEESIFVTLSGPGEYQTAGDIISHLLTNPFVGNVPEELVAIDSDVSDTEMALAIMEEKNLHDVTSQIANQGKCLLLWGAEGATLRALSNELSGAVATLDESSIAERSLNLGHSDMEAAFTCALAKFQPTCVNSEVKFFRKSTDAVAHYKERRKEIDCWALQQPEQIVDVLEFWLGYYLSQQRTLKFECFLDKGLALQPGDIVDVSFANGSGAKLLDNQLARVTRVEHVIGDAARNQMESIKVEAEYSVWTYSIDDATADLELCEGDGGDPLPIPSGDEPNSDGVGGLIFMSPPWIQQLSSSSNILIGGGGDGDYVAEEIEFVVSVGKCQYSTIKKTVLVPK